MEENKDIYISLWLHDKKKLWEVFVRKFSRNSKILKFAPFPFQHQQITFRAIQSNQSYQISRHSAGWNKKNIRNFWGV